MDNTDVNKLRGIQANNNAVEICNATTGHTVRAIAYCDGPYTAQLLVEAVKAALAQIGEEP